MKLLAFTVALLVVGGLTLQAYGGGADNHGAIAFGAGATGVPIGYLVGWRQRGLMHRRKMAMKANIGPTGHNA